MNPIWEYKIAQIPWEYKKAHGYFDKQNPKGRDEDELLISWLNEMGKEGWELIVDNQFKFYIYSRFLFKRCITQNHPYR